MKQEVSPAAIVAVIVALIAVAAIALWRAGEIGRDANAKPPGMPPEAAAEMSRRMGGMAGTTAPSKTNVGISALAPGGKGMTAPPGSPPSQ